jgi:methylenetetrahydrofolate dehydrogenase (NADP+)/methenyltetrahydrofolate cyclohydrolase
VILHGKPVQERVLAEVKEGVERLRATRGVTPTLAVVLIGEDPASQVYVRGKKRAADTVGIATRDCLYPQGIAQGELFGLLGTLSADPAVHGILLQLPLPDGLNETIALAAIAPEKDVDGLHPTNLGRLLAGEPVTMAPSCKGSRRSWWDAPGSSASRSPSCCWRGTRPSRCATPARATSPSTRAAPTCSASRPGARA